MRVPGWKPHGLTQSHWWVGVQSLGYCCKWPCSHSHTEDRHVRLKRTASCGKRLQKLFYCHPLPFLGQLARILRVNKPVPAIENNCFFFFFLKGGGSQRLWYTKPFRMGLRQKCKFHILWVALVSHTVTWQLQGQIGCCSETIFSNFLSNEWLTASRNFTHQNLCKRYLST